MGMRGQPLLANGRRCDVDWRAQLAQCCWPEWKSRERASKDGARAPRAGQGSPAPKRKRARRTNERSGRAGASKQQKAKRYVPFVLRRMSKRGRKRGVHSGTGNRPCAVCATTHRAAFRQQSAPQSEDGSQGSATERDTARGKPKCGQGERRGTNRANSISGSP